MHKTLTDLLAVDDVARRFGCGLNPKLRAAIEMDSRFPAKAASPRPSGLMAPKDLPKEIGRLRGKAG